MRRLLLFLIALALAPIAAMAQGYPDRPITIVVPFSAGGPTDTVTRLVAEAMSRDLGQQILVENVTRRRRDARCGTGRQGGSRRLHAALTPYRHGHVGHAVSKTSFQCPRGPRVHRPRHRGADGDRGAQGFRPNDLKSLIEYVKANKDKVTYANAGIGAASHLCGMLFMSNIGTKLTTVPYKGRGHKFEILSGAPTNSIA